MSVGVIAALFTAISFGLSQTLVRAGLRYGSPLDAANKSVRVSLLILWPLAIILTDFSKISFDGIAAFMLAGLLAPTLGRLLRFMGIEKLGAVESAPITATSPLFAATIAIALLGEELTTLKAGGIVLIVSGTALLSLKGFSLKRKGIATTLLAAAAFGAAENIRRIGLLLIPSPALGAAIGSSIATFSYAIYEAASHNIGKKFHKASSRKAKRYFYPAAIFQTLGQLSLFVSLTTLDVSIAAPIFRTDPLFTYIFTFIILRGIEKVTPRAIASALIIITGIVLLTSR